jgi:hypothetical protein
MRIASHPLFPPFFRRSIRAFCRWMPSGLGERDPVQGSVQLTVSGAAQPVPGFVR